MYKHPLFWLTLLSQLVVLLPISAHAQTPGELQVTPVVIDEKAKARDILKETVMVKNTSNHALNLYPSVNDINPQEGKQGFSTAENSDALSNSLANWIELSRGVVVLGPGEEKAVPFIVRLNLNAVPGAYHAQISFTEGETRQQADMHPPLGTVMVNVEVQADIKELLELNQFSTDNVFFSGDDVLFKYQLQNVGNQRLDPTGQIRIYDRKGAEVASIDVNKDGRAVSPEQVTQLASVWSAANGFGRYKALLTVNYGSSQTASVQDTAFFWIIPWKEVLTLFIFSLVMMVILALYFHRWLERRHLFKFAHAGMLHTDALRHLEEEEQVTFQPMQFTPAPPVEEPVRIEPQHMTPTPLPPIPALEHPRAPEPQRIERKSLREVLAKEETHSTHGQAINLKALRTTPVEKPAHVFHMPRTTQAPHPTQTSHVISLKKK